MLHPPWLGNMIPVHFGWSSAFRLSIPWVCQDGVVHTQQLSHSEYTFALPCRPPSAAPSPTTHHRCISFRRRPWDSLKLALYIRIYLGKKKEANGSELCLKDRSICRQRPGTARGFQVVHKPHTKKKKKWNLQLFSDWEWIQTLSPRAITSCLQLEEKETKALLFCLGMQITCVSFPVVFSTP